MKPYKTMREPADFGLGMIIPEVTCEGIVQQGWRCGRAINLLVSRKEGFLK